MGKTLVAFFSYSGTTKRLAEKISDMKNIDLLEIDTIKKYQSDYRRLLEESETEKKQNARPELKKVNINLEDYDTVILGYPNWYNTCPMVILTFLETYDMSGKVIAPFCTHGGSGMGNSESDIKKSCPDSRVIKGYSRGIADAKALENWVLSI